MLPLRSYKTKIRSRSTFKEANHFYCVV